MKLNAVYKNGFCMNSMCANWYEDSCILCYDKENSHLLITPYNSEQRNIDRCEQYTKGRCEWYTYI